MRSDRNTPIFLLGGDGPPVFHLPKLPIVSAIGQFKDDVAGVEEVYDHFGHIRHLPCDDPKGLFPQPFNGKPLAFARKFLQSNKKIRQALGLRYVDLRDGEVTELPTLGWRVEFRQMLKIKGQKRAIRMRGGYVHVFINHSGAIYNVVSTLRRGRKPRMLGTIISRKQAVKAALSKHGTTSCERVHSTLVFSSHEDASGKLRIDPTYEVVIVSCNPRRVVQYLVSKSGEVVHAENKLHYASANARTFLRIPDPNIALDKQVYDAVIASLTDPKVLANDNLVVYVGSNKKKVLAKPDGTFNYKPNEPEFAGVAVFFALDAMYELGKKWGLTKPDKPVPVYVRDRSVSDNAYFDPEADEIHLGVGSGLPSGLNQYIEYDLGVEWHENGHRFVYIQTPGKDLPGSEGGAMHESTGDMFDLLMDFWFRLTYGKQMGHELTSAEVAADRRVIGIYALPPDGIRIQKNSKRTPRDKTGEVHDDGLISGGATADLMVDMATQPGVSLSDAFTAFGKLQLAALALVPAHKVMFKDMLRAFLTADQQLSGGANKTRIEKAFADHGITLTSKVEDPDAGTKDDKVDKKAPKRKPRPRRKPQPKRTPRDRKRRA